jgi:hypothetical protein
MTDEQYMEGETMSHDNELFKTLSKIYPSYEQEEEIEGGQLELDIFDYDKVCSCEISGGSLNQTNYQDNSEDISGYYSNNVITEPIVLAGASSKKQSTRPRTEVDLLPYGEIVSNARVENIAKDVLKYIYSKYPQIYKHSSQLTIEFVVNAIREGSFRNLRKDDYARVIAAVIAEHNKSYEGFKITHPFHFLARSVESLSAQMDKLEETLNDYSYANVVRDAHLQSIEYDPDNFSKLLLTFDSDHLLNPLLYALYFHRLPVIEKLTIESDAYSLLKSILRRKDRLKSTNANYELSVARWLEKIPVLFYHKNSIGDNEIERVMAQVLLKKAVIDFRRGSLSSEASSQLFSELEKVILYNSSISSDKTERMLSAFCNVFAIKPIQIYTDSPTSEVKRCDYFTYELSNGRFINFNSVKLSDSLNIRYDPVKGRVMLRESTTRMDSILYDKVHIDSRPSSLVVNGTSILYVKRKIVRPDYVETEDEENPKEYITLSDFNINDNMTWMLENRTYDLKSVVCHDIIGDKIAIPSTRSISAVSGYFTIVIDESGKYYKYKPSMFFTLNGIVEAKDNYINNKVNKIDLDDLLRQDIGVRYKTTDLDSVKRLYRADLSREFEIDYSNNMFRHEWNEISKELALEIMSTQGCIYVYAEDYDTYKRRLAEYNFENIY